MPATLLAVDDSVTMRKVIEITFTGEDIRVVTADSADAALAAHRRESPAIVLADATLPEKSGYDLCAALKKAQPDLPVLILSSKLHPYDPAKGQAAQADDHIDKPFDTQRLIDKVNELMSSARSKPKAAAPVAAPPMPAPASQPQPSPRTSAIKAPPVSTPAATPSVKTPQAPPQNLRATIDFTARPAAKPPQPQTPAPAPVAAKPAAVANVASAPPSSRAQDVLVAATGDLSTKLTAMGLTPDQVKGVLALSTDVIERVVWEVVPTLAETIIKEELKRLTAE